jgi:excinuclease ABC subunit B
MYADKITDSMKNTIDNTNQRRKKQNDFNKKNGIIPQPLNKTKSNKLTEIFNPYKLVQSDNRPIIYSSSIKKLQEIKKKTIKKMERMAKDLNFIEAAKLRDELKEIEKNIKKKT